MKKVGLMEGTPKAGVEALRLVPPERIRVLDTETTGLSAAHDEVLQLSVIDGTGRELLNQYLRPTHTDSWPEAAEVNGITPERVAGCPTAAGALPQIQAAVDGAEVIVIYNAAFDAPFCSAMGVRWPSGAVCYDPMTEYAPVAGEWSDYFGDYRWQRLSSAAHHYGYSFAAHDALEDVRATLRVMQGLLSDEEYWALFDED